MRGAAADFDAWAANGNPGWSFDEVLPVFRRIEADADFDDRPWHGDDGPIPVSRYLDHEPAAIHAAALRAFAALGYPAVEDHNDPQAVGVGPMPMSSRSGERVTTLDAYLPRDWSSPTLTIRPDSPVARVLLEAGRAIGVQLVDGTALRADSVILAAGVYALPQFTQPTLTSAAGRAGHSLILRGNRAR